MRSDDRPCQQDNPLSIPHRNCLAAPHQTRPARATRIRQRDRQKRTIITIGDSYVLFAYHCSLAGSAVGPADRRVVHLLRSRRIHDGPFRTLPIFVEGTGIALLSATCAGMLVAWRWELTGAVVSLVSLIGFTLLIRVNNHSITAVLAVPGILYILDWVLHPHRTLSPLAGN